MNTQASSKESRGGPLCDFCSQNPAVAEYALQTSVVERPGYTIKRASIDTYVFGHKAGFGHGPRYRGGDTYVPPVLRAGPNKMRCEYCHELQQSEAKLREAVTRYGQASARLAEYTRRAEAPVRASFQVLDAAKVAIGGTIGGGIVWLLWGGAEAQINVVIWLVAGFILGLGLGLLLELHDQKQRRAAPEQNQRFAVDCAASLSVARQSLAALVADVSERIMICLSRTGSKSDGEPLKALKEARTLLETHDNC